MIQKIRPGGPSARAYLCANVRLSGCRLCRILYDARRGNRSGEIMGAGSGRRRRRVSAFLTLMLAAALVPFGSIPAAAATLTVCTNGSCDFTSIADAVVEANAGDMVLVDPGIYQELITVDKDISIVGTDDGVIIESAQRRRPEHHHLHRRGTHPPGHHRCGRSPRSGLRRRRRHLLGRRIPRDERSHDLRLVGRRRRRHRRPLGRPHRQELLLRPTTRRTWAGPSTSTVEPCGRLLVLRVQ